MACTCSARRRGCCGAVGVVCLLGGVVGLCLYRTLLDAYVTQLMALRDGEFIYRRWKDPPYPIYTQFYFFDLLNKDEVLNGAKPAFLEKGPYTYREVRHKVNVTFHGNDTLSYVDLKSYSFVPRMSAGTENDSFTSINIAAMTLSEWLENERDLVKDLTSLLLLLTGESLFLRHTAGQMLTGTLTPVPFQTLSEWLENERALVKDLTSLLLLLTGESLFVRHTTLSEWLENERDLVKDPTSLLLLLTGESLFVTHTTLSEWLENERALVKDLTSLLFLLTGESHFLRHRVAQMLTGTLTPVPFQTLSEWIENERDLVKDLTSLLLLLTGESLFVTHTVGEMLAGYHEPLLTLAKTFAPALIKDDTFGIFRIMGGQFNASDGVYTIYSGQADPRKYTYIDRWNGMREVNFWNKTGTCNMINGTVGTMYPIIQDTSEPIYVFQSDMCRSVHAVFESARTVRGIPVYRYTARPGLMQSGDNNPDNRCFCLGTCLPDGLMDGRSCHQGKQQPRQPLLLSGPVSAGRTHGRAVLSPRCAHSAVPAAFLPGRRAAAGHGLGPEARQTQASDLPRHRTDYRTGDERGQTSTDQHGRQTGASHQGNRKNTEAVLPGLVAKRDRPGGPHVRGPVQVVGPVGGARHVRRVGGSHVSGGADRAGCGRGGVQEAQRTCT
ncbi:SCARB1 [Branchiostoma lanceolatum]|uniref:SCARB1 protein n=1 Tax=Branchiostoma lanceolatum TaxID=7740 RepID=A0A8J9ZJD2_BRALA|nr:SCARB1 [Branchiostoma lanceolatum]